MSKVLYKLRVMVMVVAVNVGLVSLQAQNNDLVGMWQAKNGQSISPDMGKIFLPNGQMYGYSLVSGYTDSLSTWIMGRYKVTDQGQYVEDLDFHASIGYQYYLNMKYWIENDNSLLVTEYVNILPNGQSQTVKELWQRKALSKERIDYLTENWESLLTQARKTYGRLPAEGQTINAAADSLKNLSDNFKSAGNVNGATHFCMVRAELDSTRLEWQTDVLSLLDELDIAPMYANKYADRIVRISEAQAATPTDTLVVNAYIYRAMVNMRRNNSPATFKAINHAIELVEQSGQQQDYAELWQLKSLFFLKEGKYDETGNCALQAIKWMKGSQKYSNAQFAEIYYIAAAAMFFQERWAEALDYAEQALQLFDNQPNKQNEVRGFVYYMYDKLFQERPNDGELKKAYLHYMDDKMICAKYNDSKSNPWGLEGSYYVLESGEWNMDSPFPKKNDSSQSNNMLLFKDGSIFKITKRSENDWQAELVVIPVIKSWKDTIRKEWKEYKKKNK